MKLTIFYRENRKTRAVTKEMPDNIPETKWQYWAEKLAGRNPLLGWMVKRYTGKSMSQYFCGRCGVSRVFIKGQSCEDCRKRHEETEAAWKHLKCSTCGKPAMGYNVFGAFCSMEHYPNRQTGNAVVFESDDVVISAIPLAEGVANE